MAHIDKYNLRFEDGVDPLQIELHCIAKGGKWVESGVECGAGMIDHLMNARKLVWPERYRHRWTDLMYHEFIQNDITILMGAAGTQKTSHASEYCLLNYWARPDRTLVILSTVNMDKMDIGVWAEVKMLWQQGHERFDYLTGHVIEHKRAIATDNIEVTHRDLRKGIISRPCYVGGRWVGLGILAGVRQEYLFYLCDELQFMQESFSKSWPHLFANGNVKIIGSGNPKHDPEDQLAIAAEPKDGWNAMAEPQKTKCWDTNYLGGRCVNLIGTDSPNFDVPEGQPAPYPKLINRSFVQRLAHDHGKDSFEYYRLAKGVMKVAFASSRVITRQLCREHKAMDKAEWRDNERTAVYGLDPSYGGEDRCIGMPLFFGIGTDGTLILQIGSYRVFPFDLREGCPKPEDQIADTLDQELKVYGIDSRNCFYDSCGKGTLGGAFVRKFGVRAPVAVDAGGSCSARPVRQDLFVTEKNGEQRLMRCDEYYSKFVSEMWFSVRYAIEANQVRELSEEVMTEGCARIYEVVAGNKIRVEPKTTDKEKEDLRRRLGKSPDLFDCLAIGVEGARQRGFLIAALGTDVDAARGDDEFFDEEDKEYEKAIKDSLLVHT